MPASGGDNFNGAKALANSLAAQLPTWARRKATGTYLAVCALIMRIVFHRLIITINNDFIT